MATCAQRGCLKLFVFLLFVAVSTQQVYLQPSNTSNPECSNGGVVDGKDQVVMIGFVTTNGTTPLIFNFLIKRVGDASATQVCKIDVGTDGCGSQSTALCYCQGVSNNTYIVVYNITAREQDSNATLTLSYEGDSSVQQLPVVCIILEHEESDDVCSLGCFVGIGIGAGFTVIMTPIAIGCCYCYRNKRYSCKPKESEDLPTKPTSAAETAEPEAGPSNHYFKKTTASSGRNTVGQPVSSLSLKFNEENKHTSKVETPGEELREKKRKRRGKTSQQGDDDRDDYTGTPTGTFGHVQKRSKNANEKLEGLGHDDNQHDFDMMPRRLPPFSANKQSKDGNRTMQTTGLNVQLSPQISRPTSIEMTSASRPLPPLLPTKKESLDLDLDL